MQYITFSDLSKESLSDQELKLSIIIPEDDKSSSISCDRTIKSALCAPILISVANRKGIFLLLVK